jgi:hypothetical protein
LVDSAIEPWKYHFDELTLWVISQSFLLWVTFMDARGCRRLLQNSIRNLCEVTHWVITQTFLLWVTFMDARDYINLLQNSIRNLRELTNRSITQTFLLLVTFLDARDFRFFCRSKRLSELLQKKSLFFFFFRKKKHCLSRWTQKTEKNGSPASHVFNYN